MKKYLTTLITEKGKSLEHIILKCEDNGDFGVDYSMLVNFIASMPQDMHDAIKNMIVRIDFANGNVFHYLDHLAVGMMEAVKASE